MRTSTLRLFIVSTVFFAAIFSMGYFNALTEGLTGAPGEMACAPCHHDPVSGLNGAMQLQGLPDYVIGGQSYPIVVAVATSNEIGKQAGFQMTLLSNNGVSQGQLSESDTYVSLTQFGNRQYVQHASEPKFYSDNFATIITFPFSWTPGAVTDLTPVTGYLSAVLGNGHAVGTAGGQRGDSVFTTSQATTVVPVLTAQLDIVSNLQCNGDGNGSLNASPVGGLPPITYAWSTGATTMSVDNLSAGNYSVTITDALGQEVVLAVNLDQPAALNVAANVTHPSCGNSSDGSVFIDIAGGVAPYAIMMGGEIVANPLTDLAQGTYNFTVVDANGCESVVQADLITPDPILIELIDVTPQTPQTGGSIIIEISGGTLPYDFFWDGPNAYHGTTQNPFGLEAGSYTVTVTDGNECTEIFMIVVDFSSAVTDVDENARGLQLYPNPATVQVNVLLPEETGSDWMLMIHNERGEQLYPGSITNQVGFLFDIPKDWPSGLYLFTIKEKESGRAYTERLIKLEE